jgi:hypothetical protein
MTLQSFAESLTGLGGAEAYLSDVSVEHLGEHLEIREVFVPFSCRSNADRKKAAEKAIKPFMKDGWNEYQEEDFFNHHRWKDGRQRVRMWRWVKV